MADATAAVMDAPWERVIPDAALVEGARKCARLASGRGIMLLRVEGKVHCMDHACYHHGAPLLHADIEDLGDHKCIVCPWHNYKIDLATGEGVYVGLDSEALAAGRKEGSIKSKGIKQRVHPTQVSAASPDAAEGAPAPADPTPYIWVRESAPSEVRAIISEEACAAQASAHAGGPKVVPAPDGDKPAVEVRHRVKLGPSARGGRSEPRSGAALGGSGGAGGAGTGPRLHSSAPWANSGSGGGGAMPGAMSGAEAVAEKPAAVPLAPAPAAAAPAPVAPVAPAAATSASVAAALSTVHEPAGPERVKGTKKPRRKDPPQAGWPVTTTRICPSE
ncbi:hypothetical protein FNF28_07210 [Cafeteria roenbergensis]|uniref:Rieske domain-containing protein n=1 Tax=Cafeteria roenbergensis TaxID=33653 RepID=A0A5A8CFX7_CAFRO|nr:hypothetical protein FNF28_07210 [Cafeteria roenbergensis]